MIVYRARAFCTSGVHCGNQNCSRKFGEKDAELAKAWWGDLDYPLLMSPLKNTEYCEGYQQTPKFISLVDEDGALVESRPLEVEIMDDTVIVGVGQPYMWDLEDLLDNPPEDGRLCADAQGINFDVKGGVFIEYKIFMDKVRIMVEDVSNPNSTP